MPVNAPITIHVDTSEIHKFVDQNGLLEKELEQQILFEGFKVAQRGRDAANEDVPIAGGRLQESIKIIAPIISSDTDGFTYTSGITSGEGLGLYPSVMEFGRSPHRRQPPIQPIIDWITLKIAQGQFNISQYTGKDKIRQAAFAVSASIGWRGTEGRKFMTRGSELMHAELAPRVEAVMERWAKKSESG